MVPSDREYDSSVHLSYGDVQVDSTVQLQFLEVLLKASKTDPFWKGVTVYLGRTYGDLCPVSAIFSYMVQRGSEGGSFFCFSNDRFLTQESLVAAMWSALDKAGMDSQKYAGHSFCIGAASTAARCSMQDSLIKTLGRWESVAYTLYVRTPKETLCSMARILANGGQ